MRLRQRMLEAVTTWNEQEVDPMCNWAGHMGDALVTVITEAARAAVAEAVAAEREACCCDICFWCRDMRDEEYSDVVHEGGGAWIHEVDDEVWRCEAETIRARAAASADDTL